MMGEGSAPARAMLLEALDKLDAAVAEGAQVEGLAVVWAMRTVEPAEDVIQWVNTPGGREDLARVLGAASTAMAATG